MHFVLVHRYFVPDVPTYGRLLDRLALELTERGHAVSIACGPVGYRSTIDGREAPLGDSVQVVRFSPPPLLRKSRAADASWFAMMTFFYLVKHRRSVDVVSVTTMPPVVMGCVATLAALVSPMRVVYHCMDLFPETSLRLRELRPGPVAWCARAIDTVVMRRARTVIVLSEDMAQVVRSRGVDRVQVLPNFILEPYPLSDRSRAQSESVVIFAGNLGRFQALPEVVRAMTGPSSAASVRLRFMGDGPLREFLRRTAEANERVELMEGRPLREAMDEIDRADVGLVSLAPGIAEVAFPSKLMTYLEVGLPVLVVAETSSELARIVVENGVGAAAPPSCPDAIRAALDACLAIDLDRRSIQAVGRRLFGADRVLPAWVDEYERAAE